MGLSELTSILTALDCGKAQHHAPIVEISKGPDGLKIVTHTQAGAGIEISDPFAVSDTEQTAIVNGRRLKDALQTHTAAELRSMTADDIAIDDEGALSIGSFRMANPRAEDDEPKTVGYELFKAKELLGKCGDPEWEPQVTTQGFNDELGLILPAVSGDSVRPILCSVQFGPADNGKRRMTATDSYRLYTSTVNVPRGLSENERLVSGSDLEQWRKTTERHLGKNAAPAQIGVFCAEEDDEDWDRRRIVGLHAGQIRMASKVVPGDFPEYKKLIPTGFDANPVVIDAAEMVARQPGVKRNTTNAPLRLELQHGDGAGSDKLGWSVEQPDLGTESGTVSVSGDLPRFGEDSDVPNTVGVNPSYFREALVFASGSPKGEGKVELRNWNHLKPMIMVQQGESSDWRKADRVALQMPVRLS